jgi:hypothetical protein
MKAAHEHPGRVRRHPFVKGAADTDVPIRECERGLAVLGVARAEARLHDAPLVGREDVLRRQNDRALLHSIGAYPLGFVGAVV